MSTTSPTLLDRMRGGARNEAWDHFVELYTPMLVGWCRRLGLSDADAADLMQSVFLTLYEKLPQFEYDPTRSFRAWLKTVLLNAWRNQLRKSDGHVRLVLPDGSVSEAGMAADQLADTDPRLELDDAEYRAALVQRALAMMRERFEPTTWQACWEFVVNDRPAEDVARELGMTPNAVYLAKARVLRELRHELRYLME